MKDKMMKKGGMMEPNPYNEAPGDPEQGNLSGGGIYASWDEVMSAHLSSDMADLMQTPNMDSSHGIFGGPAPGEPMAAKPPMKTTG